MDFWYLAILTLSWLAYFLLHSFFATLFFKRSVEKSLPGVMPYYRLIFNGLAVILLLFPLWMLFSCSLFDIYQDHTGPNVSVRYPLNNSVFPAGEIYFSGTAYDQSTSVKSVFYAFQGMTNHAVFLEGAWNFSLTIARSGSYEVNIWAIDLLNNKGQVVQRDLTITNSLVSTSNPYLRTNDDLLVTANELYLGLPQTNALKTDLDLTDWFFFHPTDNITNLYITLQKINLFQTNALWFSVFTNGTNSLVQTRYLSLSETDERAFLNLGTNDLFVKIFEPLTSNEIDFQVEIKTNL